MKLAIVGAGLAGLSAARALKASGHEVAVFDKGRGPGGRMSTRRMTVEGMGEVRFDHGAQYFTAKDGAFRTKIDEWVAKGVVAPWEARFARIEDGQVTSETPTHDRYVGTPSMNALIRHLADGLHVDWGARVSAITGAPDAWKLSFEDGAEIAGFDAVLVAVPAEQVAALLGDAAPDLAEEAENAVSAPCWAVMAAFEHPLATGFDAASVTAGPLAWVARNSSKPSRDAAEAWVLHASADWSATHIEDDADYAAKALYDAFKTITGTAVQPAALAAHRWRYARIDQPSAPPATWDAGLKLGTCGDWHLEGRVEAAWLSGQALAQAVNG